jgi:hypothetical protein
VAKVLVQRTLIDVIWKASLRNIDIIDEHFGMLRVSMRTDPPEPIIITISHRLGRDGAKERLDEGLNHIRGQLAPFGSAIHYEWRGYRLVFSLTAMRQMITGYVDVEEDIVRIEITLPRLLRIFSKAIIGRICNEGALLLKGPRGS